MERFKKLNKEEMKNVTGGTKLPPPGGCPSGTVFADCDLSYGNGPNGQPFSGTVAMCVTTPIPSYCHPL